MKNMGIRQDSAALAAARRKAADEAANVRYFNPEDIHVFEQNGAFRLTLPGDRTYVSLMAYRTFPLSRPEEYISLRSEREEIGMIRSLKGFEKETCRIIRELLNRRYFVPRVRRIVSAKERYGGMIWTLDTDRGIKTIITKGIHEALSENSSGFYFITDVEGNRFEVPLDNSAASAVEWIRNHI